MRINSLLFLALVAVIFTCAITAPASAKTVYVNASRADDSGDGLTPAAAEKTLTAALGDCSNGDTVQMADGTYDEASGIYTFTWSSLVNVTIVAEHRGLAVLTNSTPGAFIVKLLNGATGWVFNGITFRSQGSTNTIEFRGASTNCKFLNCAFTIDAGKSVSNIFVGNTNNSGLHSGMVIDSCTFDLHGKTATGIISISGTSATTAATNSIQVSNCTFTWDAGNGGTLMGFANCPGVKVLNNKLTLYNDVTCTAILMYVPVSGGVYTTCAGCIIAGNTITMPATLNSPHAIWVGSEAAVAEATSDNKMDGVIIAYNRIIGTGTYAAPYTTPLHGITLGHNVGTVKGNYVRNCWYGIIIKCAGQDWALKGDISGNVLINNVHSGVYVKGATNVPIKWNTIFSTNHINGQSAGGVVIGPNETNEATGNQLMYNIVANDANDYSVQLINAATVTGFTSDFNCFYNGATPATFVSNGGVKTVAEWKALGYDTNSLYTNPKFANKALFDFRLQRSSPCVNPLSSVRLSTVGKDNFAPQFQYGAYDTVYGW